MYPQVFCMAVFHCIMYDLFHHQQDISLSALIIQFHKWYCIGKPDMAFHHGIFQQIDQLFP